MAQQAMQGQTEYNLNPSLSGIEIPKVLSELNTVLASICRMNFINPYTGVTKIQLMLNRYGITFERPMLFGDEGGITIPAEQFPVYAQNDNGHIGNISFGADKIPGGLVIRFNWCNVKGIYHLESELSRKLDSTLPSITEPIHEKWTFAGKLRKERSRIHKYRVGKSYKRKYNKRRYGISTSKGFSHKKFKKVKTGF